MIARRLLLPLFYSGRRVGIQERRLGVAIERERSGYREIEGSEEIE
jgi:hypothetical protein